MEVRRKAPQRTTVDLFLRVQPEIKAKAERLARVAAMKVSPFVAALIEVADERSVEQRPAADAASSALIANRIAMRLAELRSRAEKESGLEVAIAELDALRVEVVEALKMLVPAYEAALDRRRVVEDWPAF